MSDPIPFPEAERRARKKRQAARPAPVEGGWQSQAQTDERGRMVANLFNASLALRHDEALAGAFAHDEMQGVALLVRPLPAAPGEWAGPRPVSDADAALTQRYLQSIGLPKISKETVQDAIDLEARERPRHAFRDYLTGLVWDGRPRLDDLFPRYFGTEATNYAREIGRMFILKIVARTFRPGCQVDTMVVLVGGQGVGKSSACRVLGGEFFSDAMPDLAGSKDGSQHIRGKVLIEIPELAAMSRAESGALKAVLSRREERYRPPYGRREVIEPRQSIFVGTTNRDTFLRDETGNRRFWPIRVGRIDLGALRRDRDQIFAEAVAMFHQGAPWWPNTDFEQREIVPRQEGRFEADAWEDVIRSYLENQNSVLIRDIAIDALNFASMARVGTNDQRRIAAILQRLGWERSDRKDRRGYFPYKPKDTTND